MSHYYDLPKYAQWLIAILLMILGFVSIIPVIEYPYGILLLPILAPIFNFCSTPFLGLIGYFHYLTPMVITLSPSKKKYELHNVFTFDYFVNFKWSERGKIAQKKILRNYFQALLVIIKRIEEKELPETVKIVGNSYFFSERTAKKIGFSVQKGNLFWVINSTLQFIELSYLYSFSQGKLVIPKFWKIQKAEITGGDLLKKKAFLEGLVKKLA